MNGMPAAAVPLPEIVEDADKTPVLSVRSGAGWLCPAPVPTLTNSLIGDEVIVEGVSGEMTLSDHSEIRAR